jgi:hypothetical protein
MALPLLLGFGLPALAGSGMLAGTAAAGLAAFGAPTLAGIGAGLGTFLETGDVGKGIQTGLVAGLSGKAMGALTGGGNAALSGAIGDTTSGATKAAIDAAMKEGGKNAFLKGVTSKGLQGSLAGATLPGVGTAALVGSVMNPPTVEMPEKKTYDIPPPMPRIRSYQPKTDMSSTAEETMISYGPPMAKPEAEAELPFANYVNNYRPPAGMYGNMFAEGGEVKKMRGGGLMSIGNFGPQYGHPAFGSLAEALRQGINSSSNNKVRPFVQEVETMAKDRFGQDIFQQQQFLSDAMQPIGPTQLPLNNTIFESQPVDTLFPRPMRPDSNNGIDMLFNPISRGPLDFAYHNPGSLLQGSAMPATLQGFAEGGIVSEEMNEKELIEEAVAAIKGESDNPKEILGMFLLKFGEEQLRNLVESVQSGELDETRERFADGNKGMVNGPGDGSGKDDMVPATMDGDQDVLLTAGEFVIKKDSTDAIEKAFGGGFLDEVNDAGKDAPKKLKEKVAVA